MFYLVVILLLFIFSIYNYLIWNYDYFKKRGIPYLKPEIIFGNYKEALFGTKHFGVIIQEIYQKFPNAAYVGFFKARAPAIIVRYPELIKLVLIKEFSSFADNDFVADPERDPLFANNPFVLKGEAWKTIRGRWSLLLTSNKLKNFFEYSVKQSTLMTNYIKNHLNENIDSKTLSLKYLTNLIVSTVFGLEANCFQTDNDPFEHLSRNVFASSTFTRIGFLVNTLAPELANLFKIRLISQETTDRVFEITREILKSSDSKSIFIKKEELEAGTTENNVLQVAARILGFIHDGIETSAGTLSLCMFEIAKYPHIKRKLVEEIDEIYEKNGHLTYEAVSELPYMKQVIYETLRHYPVVATTQRVCTKPIEFPPAVPGGKPFVVSKNMTVVIPVYAIHKDPQYYSDPDAFDPERFSEENKVDKSQVIHFPFGEGPRMCLGFRLGMLNIQLGLAELLRNFEFELSSDTRDQPFNIDPSSFVIRPTIPLNIIFKERKFPK